MTPCLLQALPATSDTSILTLVAQAGPMGKTVLLVLFGLSVFCWALIVERWRTFRRSEAETAEFLEKFHAAEDLAQLAKTCSALKTSPIVALFRSGFDELNRATTRSGAGAERVDRRVMSGVERMLQRSAHAELRNMERALTFLATTASVSPFIGLFGTVWGIMNAFQGIGASGSANLAAYAPGIAEALITTAAGLATAIPAAVAYNHFNRRVRVMSIHMDEFTTDFIHLVEQYIP